MPKTFSVKEKEIISEKLKEEARNCMSLRGIKGTAVDELVKRVKISKGAFYIFYQSKEILMFEVILELHEIIENQLIHDLQQLDNTKNNCENITDIIFSYYKEIEKTPILQLITSGEIEYLMRKLPQEIIENHFLQDSLMLEKMIKFIPVSENININDYSAALRNIFMTMVYTKDLKEKDFDNSLKLLIRGLIIQLLNSKE